MEKQGLVHLYCGDGKGKTTAAVGLTVRAAGNGKRILFVQFMKGGKTGELEILRGLPTVKVLRSDKQFPFYSKMNEAQKAELSQIHNHLLDSILEELAGGNCDMLVLDEITYPYAWNLFARAKAEQIFKQAEGTVEIVATGRNPDAFFTERADYITEMKCVRHPFEKGVAAREGIEY